MNQFYDDLSTIFKEEPICYLKCNIYRKDIDTMRPNRQLRSEAIHYLMELIGSQYKNVSFKIVDPFVTNMLIHMGGEPVILQTMKQQNIFNNSLIFLPINTQTKQTGQGSHWFLMLYSVQDQILYSFDSMYECIHKNAQTMKKRLEAMKVLFKQQKNRQIKLIRYHNIAKQQNSYDCGIYTVGFFEKILQSYSAQIEQQKISKSESEQKPNLTDVQTKFCIDKLKLNAKQFTNLRVVYYEKAINSLFQHINGKNS